MAHQTSETQRKQSTPRLTGRLMDAGGFVSMFSGSDPTIGNLGIMAWLTQDAAIFLQLASPRFGRQ